MSKNKRMYGATSLGLPGIQGIKGIRSRVFFYGNSLVQDTKHRKIYFGTTQSDVDSKTKYAIITDVFEPEEYDYIMYTTTGYDYILIIRSVSKDGDDYKCLVQKINSLDLTASSSNNSADSVELSFFVTKSKIPMTIQRRNALNYFVEHKKYNSSRPTGSYDHLTAFPVIEFETSKEYLVNITLNVPSNSNYVFDSNLKVVVEFYSNQSFIMDTMLNDKYDSGESLNNTYRGNHDLYSIIKTPLSSNEWVQKEINFDDERLENFVYTIKDFDDERNGGDVIIASFPLMIAPFKRPDTHAEAYMFAYIKNGRFVDKYLIDKFDLSFIDSDDDYSTTYDYEFNDIVGESIADPDLTDNPIIPTIPDIPHSTWTCNCCGTTGNTGDYCNNCGNERYACQRGSNTGGSNTGIIYFEVDDPLNPDFGNN